VLSYEAADPDLTQVVEETADLLGLGVDAVGVLVEESEQHVIATLTVVRKSALGRCAGFTR
jgi:hypothetical protein